MNTPEMTKKIIKDISEYHSKLIEQTRAIAKIKKIMSFVDKCISFANKYIPIGVVNFWEQSNITIQELSNRIAPFYLDGKIMVDTLLAARATSASGTVATDIFGMLTDNYAHYEDNKSRTEYEELAKIYKDILSGPETESRVSTFLEPLNNNAYKKFGDSLKSIQSLNVNDDPQGPLLEMRSAIELMINSLLKLTALTNRERGDLKRIEKLPMIANFLAKDELSKVDLILANKRLDILLNQLSASKDIPLPMVAADALMTQATEILNLITSSIQIPDKNQLLHD